MILQTDKNLNAEIAAFGCYFCSCLAHAEKATGKTFNAEDVLGIWGKAKANGILGAECFVNDPIGLLALVGVKLNGVFKAENSATPSGYGFELLHFHRASDTPAGMGNAMHDHFVLGDGAGKVAFDPLGQSNTVKYGYLQNKRIFA